MSFGRNKPCWCDSGKKYKRCHGRNSGNTATPISTVIESFNKAQNRKTCHHPNAPDDCTGGIIKSHTVPVAMLRTIAHKGHVYGFSLHFGAILRRNGRFLPQKIGIGNASTFYGFCAKHDNEVFAPIENDIFDPCERNACLLAYRNLIRELYAKGGADEILQHPDSGLPQIHQAVASIETNPMIEGTKAALRDIRTRKHQLDKMLLNNDFEAMQYYAFKFDQPLEILCAGCKNPQYDFAGLQLQDLSDLQTPAADLSFSLMNREEDGYAFFAWHEDAQHVCIPFVRSLIELSEDHIPHAIVRFACGGFENQFWSPQWWESLDEQTQNALLSRMSNTVDLNMLLKPDYLCDDLVRCVNWSCIDHRANVKL